MSDWKQDLDRWLTTPPEPDDRCDSCGETVPEDYVDDVDADRIFCNDQCKADYETGRVEDEIRRSEAAYERSLERFYGGDTPTTDREIQMDTWRQKRGLK